MEQIVQYKLVGMMLLLRNMCNLRTISSILKALQLLIDSQSFPIIIYRIRQESKNQKKRYVYLYEYIKLFIFFFNNKKKLIDDDEWELLDERKKKY